MTVKKLMSSKQLIAPFLAAMIGAGMIFVACTPDGGGEARESGGAIGGQETTELAGESGGEGHGPGGEGGAEGGGEGTEGAGSGGEEGSGGANLAPNETFDMVRGGARLIMNYDPASNSFTGTMHNTTASVLTRVRIEIHLDNGTELGPTTPVDLAPGETRPVVLASTQAPFNGWVAHAEVGRGEGGGESAGGESGSEGGGEGGTGAEAGEAAMSSPAVPLGQTWEGNLGGLAVYARYDAATRSVESIVRNTTPQVLCYVQTEPHLKSGSQTVGELGPDVLGHLSPGQSAVSSVSVDTEPNLAGVSFDGYVIHLEVFDCAGSGPVPHTGGEGGAEGGAGEAGGGEGHGPGGEGGAEGGGEGTEGAGSGGEEGSGGANLAPNETFDMVRGGARLIMNYDPASNSFTGTMHNTTASVLTRVRIEIHLDNGTELGPTTPVDLAPGETRPVVLASTQAPFNGWVAHAEVGRGEGGGESAGGESGSEGGGEGGAEHGGSGESAQGEGRGEHGA